jgi:hypothetical protein
MAELSLLSFAEISRGLRMIDVTIFQFEDALDLKI